MKQAICHYCGKAVTDLNILSRHYYVICPSCKVLEEFDLLVVSPPLRHESLEPLCVRCGKSIKKEPKYFYRCSDYCYDCLLDKIQSDTGRDIREEIEALSSPKRGSTMTQCICSECGAIIENLGMIKSGKCVCAKCYVKDINEDAKQAIKHVLEGEREDRECATHSMFTNMDSREMFPNLTKLCDERSEIKAIVDAIKANKPTKDIKPTKEFSPLTLNEVKQMAYEIAVSHGFHRDETNLLTLPTKLMLVVSEVSAAMEAHRNGAESIDPVRVIGDYLSYAPEEFDQVRGTIEEEIADAIIRLADIAAMLNMDLDWWVRHKMAYESRGINLGGKAY